MGGAGRRSFAADGLSRETRDWRSRRWCGRLPERPTGRWQYQLRINLSDRAAEAARAGEIHPDLEPLGAILARHNAVLKCQYDAFAGYCAEAERQGIDRYPLYAWTKATIEDPTKKARYVKSFTLHVDGDEVYGKDRADALEAELAPLVGGAGGDRPWRSTTPIQPTTRNRRNDTGPDSAGEARPVPAGTAVDNVPRPKYG